MNILICTLTLLLATGCTVDFGVTERAQIRANAQVRVAQAEQTAREAEALATVQAEIARQAGAQLRTATIAMMVPIALLISVVGAIISLIIYWRGRIELEKASWEQLPSVVVQPELPRAWREALQRKNLHAEYDYGNNVWWVTRPDGERLPKPITQKMLEGK